MKNIDEMTELLRIEINEINKSLKRIEDKHSDEFNELRMALKNKIECRAYDPKNPKELIKKIK